MGEGINFMDKLKDVWAKAEDKWYNFLDSLESKGIPVYKVIDPIDKVVPSLAVAIGLVMVLVFLLVFLLFFSGPSLHKVQFLLQSDNLPLAGVSVSIMQDSVEEKGFQGIDTLIESNAEGIAEIDLFASSVLVSVNEKGFDKFSEEFDLIDEDGILVNLIKVNLVPEKTGPESVSISLKDSDSRSSIKKKAVLSFSCSQGTPPAEKTTYNGSVSVAYPKDCVDLTVSVSIDGYSSKSQQLQDSLETIYLDAIETEPDNTENTEAYAELSVLVLDQNDNPLPDIMLSLKEELTGLQKDSHLTDSSGSAVFYSIEPNNYIVEAYDSVSGANDSQEIQLTEDASEEITFTLNTDTSGERIYLKFIDSNTLEPVEGVKVNVFVDKELSTVTDSSDSDGLIEIAWAEEFESLAILASHDDYVSYVLDEVSLKGPYEEAEEIILEPANATNSGTALIKVFDDPTKGEILVSGASVKMFNSRYSNLFLAFGSTTDAGTIEFINLPLEGKYTAKAALEQVTGESDQNTLKAGTQTEFKVYLDNPLKFNLTVIVQDPNGVTVTDAVVKAYDKALKESVEGITDSSGLLELELPVQRNYELRISKESFLESRRPLAEVLGSEQRIELMTLYPEGFVSEPTMFFEGYYSASNKGVYLDGFVEKNKSYYAVISTVIPKTESFNSVVSNARLDLDSKTKAEEIELMFTGAAAPENTVLYFLDEFNPNNIFRENASTGTEFKSINAKNTNVTAITNSSLLKFYVRNWAHEGEPKIPMHYQDKYRSSTNEKTMDKKTEEFIVSNCEECSPEGFFYYFKMNNNSINPSQRTELNLEREYVLETIIENKTFEEAEDLDLTAVDATIPELNGDANKVLEINPDEINIESIAVDDEFNTEINVIGLKDSSNAKMSLELDSKYPNDSETVLFKIIPKSELLLSINQTEFLEKQLTYFISGKAVDADGNFIPHALIKFDHTPPEQALEIHEQTFTDENGFFEYQLNLPLFAPNPLIISGEAAGYLSSSVEIPVKNEARFDSGEKPECIKITPNSQEITVSRGDISSFEIKNLCSEEWDASVSSVTTSDLKFLAGEGTQYNYTKSIHLMQGEAVSVYIKTDILNGLHPVFISFIPETETEFQPFTAEMKVTVNPQASDYFDLIGRDDGQKRYEFSLFSSADKIRAVYNGFNPESVPNECSFSSLELCPPWISGLEENTRNINPNNAVIWLSSIDGIEINYNKVYLSGKFPGIGQETETGILADSLARKGLFSPTLDITTSSTGEGIALIKIGIGSDSLGETPLINSLELKLNASENSSAIKAHHFYNSTWSEGDSFSIPVTGVDESAFFISQETAKDTSIVIDLKKAGIEYKGIYSIALSLAGEGTAQFYSKDSKVYTACLVVNGTEYCGSNEDLGDCFFDSENKSRYIGEDYWIKNWDNLPEEQRPLLEAGDSLGSCVYCATSSGLITGAEGTETGCYGDKRKLFFNSDGSIKEGFTLEPIGGGRYTITPQEEAERIMKENCTPFKDEFDMTAKLRVYDASGEEDEEEAEAKEKETGKAFFTDLPGENSFEWMHQDDPFYDPDYYGGNSGDNSGGSNTSDSTCSELGGVACSGSTPECSQSWTSAEDGLCCLGSCVATGSGYSQGSSVDPDEVELSFSCDFSEGSCDDMELVGGTWIDDLGWYSGPSSDVTGYLNENKNQTALFAPPTGTCSQLGGETCSSSETCDSWIDESKRCCEEGMCHADSGDDSGDDDSDSEGSFSSNCNVGAGEHFGAVCLTAPEGKEIDFESPGFIEMSFRFIDSPEERASKRFGLLDASWFTRIEKLDEGFPAVSNSVSLRKFADYMTFGTDADFDLNESHSIRVEWDEEEVRLYLDGGEIRTGERTIIEEGGINDPHPFNQKEMAIVIGDNWNANMHASEDNPPVIYENISFGFNVNDVPEPGALGDLVSGHNIGFLSDPRFASGGIHFSKEVEFLLGEGTVKGMIQDVTFTCDGTEYKVLEGSVDFRNEREEFEDKFDSIGWNFKGINAPYTGFITLNEIKDKTCSNAVVSFYGRNQLVYGRSGTQMFGMHPVEENGNNAWYDSFALIKQLIAAEGTMKLIRFGFYSRNPCAPSEQYIWADEEGISNANDWLYFSISWSPGYDSEEDIFDDEAEAKSIESINPVTFTWNELPEKTRLLLSGEEKTKFLPGEPRDLVDIDLINTGFDGTKYGVIAIADLTQNNSGINTGFFHSKFIGSSSECTKFTSEGEVIGESSSTEYAKISDDYSWDNRFSRCNAVESGVYCDGAQFLQKYSSNIEKMHALIQEGKSFESNEVQALISFDVMLKREGLSKDLVNDFTSWAIAGESGEWVPGTFRDLQSLFTGNLTDFRLLGEHLEIIDETSDSNPAIDLEPGVYRVIIQPEFKSNNNKKFMEGTEIKVNKFLIILRKISSPAKESVFYYLPFDSTLGNIDGTREGYGTVVSGDESSIKEFSLRNISGGLVDLSIENINDFALLNNDYRSSLLQIEKNGTDSYNVIQALPYATPVLMLVSDDKYDAFYSLERASNNPASGLSSAGIWTGMASTMQKENSQSCSGFENNSLPRAFADAAASVWKAEGFETEIAEENESKSYGLSFKKTNASGSFPKGNAIGLYSVFYTTSSPIYGSDITYLVNNSTGNALFIDPETKNSLPRISLNYIKKQFLSLKDVLNSIDNENTACIAIEKTSADIFWNEDKLAFDAFQSFISNKPGVNYCPPNQTQQYGSNDWGNGN
ncbi:MAG: carboxypeptidase regulatory-like domain-containing protein [Candidatus Diapherotrites archaeon]|nr:carboxypeptidase regulatory-like domain-containing protein [Candidatus Diapherotrites archaeon]